MVFLALLYKSSLLEDIFPLLLSPKGEVPTDDENESMWQLNCHFSKRTTFKSCYSH